MGVLNHFGDVARGQSLGDLVNDNMEVADGEDTLYSGRVCTKNASGQATEGHGTDQTDVCFFVVEGVEKPGVSGSSAVSDSLNDYDLIGGTVGTIPFQQGLKVRTSEFNDEESYSLGDPIEISGTDDGTFTLGADPTSADVVAVVDGEVEQVHDLDVLTIEIIRQAPTA